MGHNKVSNADDRRINLCLASPLFYPTYGGSQLRFLRYLPGFSKRGIDVRIVSGTPTPRDVTASDIVEAWSRYPAGTLLPVEIVNGVPITRVRLPDKGGLHRSFHYLRTLYRHCRSHRPDVLQLFGTLSYNAVPLLWRLRAMGIPSVYAITITSKLNKQRKSPLRRWLTMSKLRNRALFNALDCIIVNNDKMRELMREMQRSVAQGLGARTRKLAPCASGICRAAQGPPGSPPERFQGESRTIDRRLGRSRAGAFHRPGREC
jgi:glycosyltransferase involved in cell wall biosynthesis